MPVFAQYFCFQELKYLICSDMKVYLIPFSKDKVRNYDAYLALYQKGIEKHYSLLVPSFKKYGIEENQI